MIVKVICITGRIEIMFQSGVDDVILITDYEWDDGGLPIVGHSLLIIEDENDV